VSAELAAKYVELPTRVKLNYIEQGDSSGIPVLMLHGVTDSWRSFERVLPHLPTSIIADSQFVVYRGVGHTLHWEEPERFATDLMSFIERHVW
jgi:pimeloyl-ACP methyl ester carboxylesterase